MSDTAEEMLILAALLLLLMRRRRRRQSSSRHRIDDSREEIAAISNGTTAESSSNGPQCGRTSKKRKRCTQLPRRKKVQRSLNFDNCADDSLDNPLSSIKCEQTDADDEGSISYDQKDIQGVVIKDEPFDGTLPTILPVRKRFATAPN